MYENRGCLNDLRMRGFLYFFFIALQVLDLYTTSIILNNGGFEMNGILLFITSFMPFNFITSFLILKFLLICVVTVFIANYLLLREDYLIYTVYFLMLSDFIFFVICLHNVGVIIHMYNMREVLISCL